MLEYSGNDPFSPRIITAFCFKSFWVTKKGNVVVIVTTIDGDGKAQEAFNYLDQEDWCSGSIDPNCWGPGVGLEQ